MYVRTLKPGDRLHISELDADGVEIKLLDVNGGAVTVGFERPDGADLRVAKLATDAVHRQAYKDRVAAKRAAQFARYHHQLVAGVCKCGKRWPHQ